MTDQDGLALSKRRITVSTSGVVPIIQRLGEEFRGIKLGNALRRLCLRFLIHNIAISLHAATDALRYLQPIVYLQFLNREHT